MMRNIFDQYQQPENRLSHALACSLAEDPRLLIDFIQWATGVTNLPAKLKLKIVEQRLPGTDIESEETQDSQKGLPDIWVYSEEGWSLLIESKIASLIDNDQLKRHLATADRRGFPNRILLVLSLDDPTSSLPTGVMHKRWSDLYLWAWKQRDKSPWAVKFTDFMEIAERKYVNEEYLQRGTLTMFTGIRFDDENPYNYLEAKRLLKLLFSEIRSSKVLQTSKFDLARSGRAAITGKNTDSVWDFFWPLDADAKDEFTKIPHFTISLKNDRVLTQLTIPNDVPRRTRNSLKNDGINNLKLSLDLFVKNIAPILNADTDARPFVAILQRHYLRIGGVPVQDAFLEFDPRTALPGRDARVKIQGEWLQASFDAFTKPGSNLQLAIGISFLYGKATEDGPKFVRAVESILSACSSLKSDLGF